MNEQKCRICGCTEDNCSQCIKLTGHPCHWVEENLCSACQDAINNKSPLNNTDMNFFEQLSANGPVDMTMRIMSKNDKLTINIMPGSKVSKTQPLIITGTAAELDEAFFSTIAPEVKEIAGLISNIETVKKDIAEKKEKKAAVKEKPKAEKPKTKTAAKKAEAKSSPKKKEEPVAAEKSLFDEEETVDKS